MSLLLLPVLCTFVILCCNDLMENEHSIILGRIWIWIPFIDCQLIIAFIFQMAFTSRMASPRVLTAAAVGGAALAGLYYNSNTLEAGASSGEHSSSYYVYLYIISLPGSIRNHLPWGKAEVQPSSLMRLLQAPTSSSLQVQTSLICPSTTTSWPTISPGR